MPIFVPPAIQDTSHTQKTKPIVIHGRLSVWNGTPSYRIWKIGTKRILALSPDESLDRLPKSIRKYVRFDVNIYGDFTLEELEPSTPGRMQHVRILEIRNVVIEETNGAEGPRAFKLLEVAP